MAKGLPLSNQIIIGGRLNEQDLRTLAAEGVRSIVNLLPASEYSPGSSPDDEGRLIQQLGMRYLYLPVPAANMCSPELVDQFIKGLARLPRPVFVHCQSGRRAGVFAAVALGVEQRLSGESALQHARQLGFNPGSPDLADFIKTQTDQYQEQTQKG